VQASNAGSGFVEPQASDVRRAVAQLGLATAAEHYVDYLTWTHEDHVDLANSNQEPS
jgi:hypothetical protein